MGLPSPPVPYLGRRVIRPRSGKVLRPPPGSPAFFCDAFQGGSLEPHFYGASQFYDETYGFSSGPVSEPRFDPTDQRVCSHWASCASRHLVSGDSAGGEHLWDRGMDTTVASCWGARWGFSARLFPLLRGWLPPLDSSGGRMEYSVIPTAATAPRFCARGSSWLFMAVHVVVRPLRLCRSDGCLCATEAFTNRSEAVGSARHGVGSGSPVCKKAARLQSGLPGSGEGGNQEQVEGAAVAGTAWQSVGVRRREPSIRIIVSTSRSGSPRSA